MCEFDFPQICTIQFGLFWYGSLGVKFIANGQPICSKNSIENSLKEIYFGSKVAEI